MRTAPRPMPTYVLSVLAAVVLGAAVAGCDSSDEVGPSRAPDPTETTVEPTERTYSNLTHLATGDRLSLPDGWTVDSWTGRVDLAEGGSLTVGPLVDEAATVGCTTAASCAADYAWWVGQAPTETKVGDVTYHGGAASSTSMHWYLDREDGVLHINGEAADDASGAKLVDLVYSIDWEGDDGSPVWFPDGTRIGVGAPSELTLKQNETQLTRPGGDPLDGVSVGLMDSWCTSAATCSDDEPLDHDPGTTTKTVNGVAYHVSALTTADASPFGPSETWYCEHDGRVYSFRGKTSTLPAFMAEVEWVQ